MQHRLYYFLIIARNALPLIPIWARILVPLLAVGWIAATILLPRPSEPVVDWLSWGAVVIGLAAAVWFHIGADLRSRYPRAVLAGAALCLGLCIFCLGRELSLGLLVRLALPLLLVALHAFYIFYFSVYRGRERISRLQVGDRFPDFALPDSTGRIMMLADVLAKGPVLFTFYKGDW